ncbi:MAG: hypothetical protein M0Q38_07750 [Bacteroidales bacterium]|jgi:hypothetical protein|nr:hypothetical protein [Bacteroidales bacterium]
MESSCQVKGKPQSVKEYLKSWHFWKAVIAVIVGGTGGFLYYHFVGCASESCAITGNPYASIAFGGFLGYFVVNRPCAC